MNPNLRTCAAIVLLAICGCASAEAVDLVRAQQYNGVVQTEMPDGGVGLREAATADVSEAQSKMDLARFSGNATKATVKDDALAAGEHRATSGRRLTLQQKRIFVLGLAARENK